MTSSPIRRSAVAGRFYPSDPDTLTRDVRSYLTDAPRRIPVRALGCIAPHAGYMYSGHVAGAVFAVVKVPPLCIVIGPNHTGVGRPLAIVSGGWWETPTGNIPIASRLADALMQSCPLLEEDSSAHRAEHAIEVELPFLHMLQPDLQFVPIAVGTGRFEALDQLGNAVADVVAAQTDPVLIIVSSDMNHYESDAVTRVKDQIALDTILRLDAHSLYDVVTRQHISMCGYGPAVAMLIAIKKLGGVSAELVKYATSGDISGDRDSVVGYAGIIVPAP